MAVAKELTDLKLQIRVEDGLTSAGAAKIKCMADGFETSVKLDELVDYFAD